MLLAPPEPPPEPPPLDISASNLGAGKRKHLAFIIVGYERVLLWIFRFTWKSRPP